MKKILLFLLPVIAGSIATSAQTNMMSANALAEQVLLGKYDPVTFKAATVITDPATISAEINARISPDSLHAYLEALAKFTNRNTCSDTVSSTKGIGAARRWIYSKFQEFSAKNDNRLVPSFLQFDIGSCNITELRDVFAVLPGTDTSDKNAILIEAHMDSRCLDNLDTACLAQGMEDNGSGTVLVMELARVMSKYSFKRSIVFMATTGEEQGLLGAEAFADYAKQKSIGLRAVMNNDVIGGVICGNTSSPPSCAGAGSVDSLNVRMFSFGNFNSPHKQLSRFIKLEYKEMILPSVKVPMTIHVMSDEDRTGRGGDHIPFRQNSFTAMRFTCANENGDGNPSQTGYSDRQHTSTDILGDDLNSDGILDKFYVDFNYLARNTVINGNAAAMAALGPQTPDFNYLPADLEHIKLQIIDPLQYGNYRIALRTTTNDWDTVYTVTATGLCEIPVAPGSYIVSIASVDSKGIESLFSKEIRVTTAVTDPKAKAMGIEMLQNSPNPFDDKTTIIIAVTKPVDYKEAYVSVTDILGREVKRLPIALRQGMNEVLFEHGYHATGSYQCTLVVDGKALQSKKMIFKN